MVERTEIRRTIGSPGISASCCFNTIRLRACQPETARVQRLNSRVIKVIIKGDWAIVRVIGRHEKAGLLKTPLKSGGGEQRFYASVTTVLNMPNAHRPIPSSLLPCFCLHHWQIAQPLNIQSVKVLFNQTMSRTRR